MEKINLVELLKDCPKGLELDCTMYEGVVFDCIADEDFLPIRCLIKNSKGGYNVCHFTEYGCWSDVDSAKCVIFPKGKTSWEGFQRPFKDGDVVSTESGMYIGIVKSTEDDHKCLTFCSVHGKKGFHVGKELYFSRLATKEEKQIMFDIIKANGYHWNAKIKTLEKLPKFKVGDRIKHKDSGLYCTLGEYAEGISAYRTNIRLSITPTDLERWELVPDKPYFKIGDRIRRKNNTTIIKTIGYIYSDSYALYDGCLLYFEKQDEWELVPNKFDINTLKPFDQVLVRNSDKGRWVGQFYTVYNRKEEYPFECTYNSWKYCIPYKGNEHLLDETDDCSNYYKIWE